MNRFINTGQNYICITRPRRFGKTVNAKMLGAYYTIGFDSHVLFDNLNISKTKTYEKHLNKHHVIFIDFSRMPNFCDSYEDYIKSIYKKMMDDLKEIYSIDVSTFDSISTVFKATNDSFIFILDEWDSIFYEDFMTKENKIAYLKFLKGLLKDQPYVELAYMTGVLPIPKYSSGSDLNIFREYNFMNDIIYQDFFGFHEDELKELCKKYAKPTYDELEFWYNGYTLNNGNGLYNPLSVSCALRRGKCRNYWAITGPMNEIADCIKQNVDAVREDIVRLVSGQNVYKILYGYNTMELQLHDRDEILSAMVVYGFLSYHDGILRIPNYELMEKFQTTLSREIVGEVSK